MLLTKRTFYLINLKIACLPPFSQTFTMVFHFAISTTLSFFYFELIKTYSATWFLFFILILFFLVMDYRHLLYGLNELLGWRFSWNATVILNLKLITIYWNFWMFFNLLTNLALFLMPFFVFIVDPYPTKC